MAKPSIHSDYQAGAGARREQLAALLDDQLGVGGRGLSAAVHHLGLAANHAGVGGDRAQVLHLEGLAGVADPGRKRGVDGTAQRRVENRRGVAAVHDADRVVVLLPGSPSKTALPSSTQAIAKFISTAIGGAGISPDWIARMKSRPDIRIP